MSILSLNVRGLGKAKRVRALSKLMLDIIPIIIFLQETMCPYFVATKTLANIFPCWELSAVNALGLLGGSLA